MSTRGQPAHESWRADWHFAPYPHQPSCAVSLLMRSMRPPNLSLLQLPRLDTLPLCHHERQYLLHPATQTDIRYAQMLQEWFQKILKFLADRLLRFLANSVQAVWKDFQASLREALTPKWLVSIRQKREERERARIRIAEAAAEQRLDNLLRGEVSSISKQVLTFRELYRYVKPPSPEWLVFVATRFLTLNEELGWSRVFRVKSPTSSLFYKDFASLEQIPDELFEEKSQKSFEVDLSLISVVLKRATE